MAKVCSEIEAIVGCKTDAAGVKTSVAIHYEYRVSATGNRTLHATRYTDAAGVALTLAAGESVSPGACAVASPDVEFQVLCDVSAAGVTTKFVRRTVTTFDALGAPTTVVANLGLDYQTVYVPSGTVGNCDECDASTAVGVLTTWG